MAILALSSDLEDMQQRIGRIVIGQDTEGGPVSADDLGVVDALTVLMKDTVQPTLMQTVEVIMVFIQTSHYYQEIADRYY